MRGRAHVASHAGAHRDVVLGAAVGVRSAGVRLTRVPQAAQPGVPLVVELETKVIRRFPKISQSRRRPLLGPSPC